MKYMGSKRRIAKQIIPIMLEGRYPGQYYIEPFCGGCNTLEHVEGNRIGSDIHPELISMWKSVAHGWLPPTFPITEEFYNHIKEDSSRYTSLYHKTMVGYAGFALSYGGKFWGGYRRDKAGKRDYSLEAFRNALIQFPKLHGVWFECTSYENLLIPSRSIIYCDPPYLGTTGYGKKNHFKTGAFWQWCKLQVDKGHTVFASEYYCPIPHTVVFEKEQTSTLVKNTGAKRAIEKLFKIL